MSNATMTSENKKVVVGHFANLPVVDSAVESPAPSYERSAPSQPVVSPLEQLQANVDQLEELTHRLSFMMSEVSSVIK